jgi:hypothetical protein
MVSWKDAVLSSLKSYSARHATRVIERQAFIDEELASIVSATGTRGATPEQTVSRVLQELREDGTLEFLDPGRYRLLDSPIDIEQDDVRSAPAHHEDASANSGKADGSRALIVTWNPERGSGPRCRGDTTTPSNRLRGVRP